MAEPGEVEPERSHPDDEGLGPEPVVTIEIAGLSVYTHHGVEAAEREVGQRLAFDLSLALAGCDATITDRLDDTVDYAEVAQEVYLAAQERSYRTLERLCAAIAERLIDRYAVESVGVRATKSGPPLPLPVEDVTVEVVKERL